MTIKTPAGLRDALVTHVQDARFPCVAARSVFNREDWTLSAHARMDALAAAELCGRLREFAEDAEADPERLRSFVAVFPEQPVEDELHFERLLWDQLQALHAVDVRHHAWDTAVSDDPEDERFGFSVGGHAWFVVGLHPAASRLSRRTPFPVLVFNLHAQFERLRAQGKYDRMVQVVRARDAALQGTINPMMSDFGTRSEARQYAGRAVSDDWRCPFSHLGKGSGH